MDSANTKIISGFIRCLIQLKQFDNALEMFDSFENSILENEEISKLKKFLDNSMKGSNNNSYDLKNHHQNYVRNVLLQVDECDK